MKHSMTITLMMILTFVVSQFLGILIINNYMAVEQGDETSVKYSELPFDIERPVEESNYSWLPIMFAILIGTLLLLVIIKFRKPIVWKGWFFLSVSLSLLISFYSFIMKLTFLNTQVLAIIALILSAVLAYYKIFKPNIYIHNITELFIYGGIAALFVPVLNLFSMTILLLLIALYDMYAVWKSKHMVKLAQFQTQSKTFAGIMFNKKDKTENKIVSKSKSTKKTTKKAVKQASKKSKSGGFAILGGGDIAFPLLFTGVVLKRLLLIYPGYQAILLSLILIAVNALGLFLLLYFAKKERFYPAMPFLAASSFVGYGILYLFI